MRGQFRTQQSIEDELCEREEEMRRAEATGGLLAMRAVRERIRYLVDELRKINVLHAPVGEG